MHRDLPPPEPTSEPRPLRKPPWLRVRLPSGELPAWLANLLREKRLHTVCEEANCPNLGHCWGRGTATFLIMGDICTRNCRFCNVRIGRPAPLDPEEPQHVAEAIALMELRHVVITSVDRDDLPDGGAAHFAATIRAVRAARPECTIEVLIPDFRGQREPLATILAEQPTILNHNIEMVRRLYPQIRPQGKYEWALAVLQAARAIAPQGLTKCGFMVGLGETWEEILATLRDLRAVDVNIVTIGQYLQPTRQHWPVARYVTPEEFAQLAQLGLELGFQWVESGPLVRSSYQAEAQAQALVHNGPALPHAETAAPPGGNSSF